MNKQGPGGIEWCDFSWNPIKGLCPEACWYCYARAMYRRFKWDREIQLNETELCALGDCWHRDCAMTFDGKLRMKAGQKIFACSTFEIFSPIADKWRGMIFEVIRNHPEHTFIILTKRPERIDRPMPENVWLGVSVTGDSNIDYLRVRWLEKAAARIKFVSFEPLLGDPCIWDLFDSEYPSWMIAGRLTGHGHKHDPKLRTLTEIVEFGTANKIPIFLKNNLKDIWPGPLVQEYPR